MDGEGEVLIRVNEYGKDDASQAARLVCSGGIQVTWDKESTVGDCGRTVYRFTSALGWTMENMRAVRWWCGRIRECEAHAF